MHFEYEIGPEEFVRSQVLYFKLSSGRKRARGIAVAILGGLLFIFAAFSRTNFGWDDFFLILLALWWLYAGFQKLLPGPFYRRAYKSADLAGKKFKADVNDAGFEVSGEDCAWRVQWTGVRLKAEDERVFMICSTGTIFMFGRKYLTNEQQQEFRRLAGLVSS
jgi:hypothetical protein